MLNFIIILSCLFSIVSGIAALYFGHWEELRLKFIAVALSTTACIGILLLRTNSAEVAVCNGSNITCADFGIMICMVYVSLGIFHVASGLDAMAIRQGGRRENDRGVYSNAGFRKRSAG